VTRVPQYGPVARLLHRIALSDLGLQRSLAELEDRLLGVNRSGDAPPRPVFLTSLPRAGTTLLLELLYATGEFSAHTYRQMPFVLAPLLWQSLATPFRRSAQLTERTHGDGLQVGFDSPEAFEEIIWMSFYAPRYRLTELPIWTEKAYLPSLHTFFSRHLAKLSRSAPNGERGDRYLSKNNVNIARLALLPRYFEDCQILIPIRHPEAQIASLQRQHERFLALHHADPFARDFMRWIGHHDFGASLKPLDFDQWLQANETPDVGSPRFWRAYWLATYEHILRHAETRTDIVLFDLEKARREPRPALEALGERLGLANPGALIAAAERIRPAIRHEPVSDPALAELYQRLTRAAL